MATWAVVRGDEVYVYIRGELVMKRWLKHGVDVTFHGILTRWSNDGKEGHPWLGTQVYERTT